MIPVHAEAARNINSAAAKNNYERKKVTLSGRIRSDEVRNIDL